MDKPHRHNQNPVGAFGEAHAVRLYRDSPLLPYSPTPLLWSTEMKSTVMLRSI
ncbi:MAG: hypothetical protein QNJ68_18255 [Microcoleaceae cyanobacterium MO_207.B10]|nr:hypothetical protein [Microcoleaceae cyanobacterium MO_207.B10]